MEKINVKIKKTEPIREINRSMNHNEETKNKDWLKLMIWLKTRHISKTNKNLTLIQNKQLAL